MHIFDYSKIPEKLYTPELMNLVSTIHEHKGKQELFLEANVDDLKTLLMLAKIQRAQGHQTGLKEYFLTVG